MVLGAFFTMFALRDPSSVGGIIAAPPKPHLAQLAGRAGSRDARSARERTGATNPFSGLGNRGPMHAPFACEVECKVQAQRHTIRRIATSLAKAALRSPS